MMENHSQTWGGQGNLIVPCDGRQIEGDGELPELDERFWPVVSAFDPDHLGVYNWTRRGSEMADPTRFAKFVRDEAERFVQEHGGTVEEMERQLREDHIHRSISQPLQPGPKTTNWAERRLGCFGRHSDAVRVTHEKAEEEPKRELVDIAARAGTPITRVIAPDLTAFSMEAQLLVAGWLGAVSPRYESYLVDQNVEVSRPIVAEEHLATVLVAALTRRSDRLADSIAAAIRAQQGGPEPAAPDYLADGLLTSSPFACTLRGTTQVHRYTMEWEQRPLTVVVGSTIADFSLAVAADRMFGGAVWLPFEPTGTLTEEQEAISAAAIRAINDMLGFGGRERMRVLTTSDVDIEAVSAYLSGRVFSFSSNDGDGDGDEMPSLWSIPPQRIVGQADWYEVRTETFVKDSMAARLDPPVPAVADTEDVWSARWIYEASIQGFTPPRRSPIAGLLAEESDWERGAVRPSADGISFTSHRMGLVLAGAPIRDALARPRLRTPSADQIVAALLKANDMTCSPSAAGLYTRRTLDRWGGLDALASDLSSAPARAILGAYTSTTARVGCYLETTRRRFLCFEDMVTTAATERASVRSFVDRLVELRVLRRGLLLKCSDCLHLGWYSAEAVGQRFSCTRCATAQTIVAASWRQPDEPSWFYDLAEVVYQALDHNAHVPVLALAALKVEGGARPFDFTSDLDIYSDGAKVDEVDFVAVANGRVLVGEAKKGTTLTDRGRADDEQNALAKLVEVADALAADEIIVASSSPTFNSATLAALRAEGAQKGIDVRTMTSVGSLI